MREPALIHDALFYPARSVKAVDRQGDAVSRPISWLSRIDSLLSSIESSVRSHYGRKDLEHLFALQPRAALKLLTLLPTIQLGNSKYVERSSLAEFLISIQQTGNAGQVMARYRKLRTAPRRRLRELVPRDQPVADADSLPRNLVASPGNLTIHFQSVEELVTALTSLAAILDDDLERFAELYEPPSQTIEDLAEPGEYEQMLEELEEMERRRQSEKR